MWQMNIKWIDHLHFFKSILLFEHPFHHSVRPSQGFPDTLSKLDVSHTSILWWNLRFATFCHRQWWRPRKEVLGGSCYLEGRFPNEGSYIKPNSPTTFKDAVDCFLVSKWFLVHCFLFVFDILALTFDWWFRFAWCGVKVQEYIPYVP